MLIGPILGSGAAEGIATRANIMHGMHKWMCVDRPRDVGVRASPTWIVASVSGLKVESCAKL